MEELRLNANKLTSVPAELGGLGALKYLLVFLRERADERAGGVGGGWAVGEEGV